MARTSKLRLRRSATTLMKEMVIKNPSITNKEVLEVLASKYDLHPSPGAIGALRNGFVQSLRVLANAGMLDKRLASRLPPPGTYIV